MANTISNTMKKIIKKIKSIYNKVKLERKYRKKLKEIKKRDPFVYKNM
jgi:hypothetical protein